MDTGTDFIRPEFLNILFFQQKNLVIFPYVDLKHLHGLEIFTVGHNIVDLESTALHNLREVLKFEVDNSYSQIPTLYFIYNVNKEKLHEIMGLDNVRCIINVNENVKELANGSSFIFFNKKNNQFLNYNVTDAELEFENHLITTSEDEIILHDKIQMIKSAAARLFTEINKDNDLKDLPEILKNYNKKYWNDILSFTERYFNIEVPQISHLKFPRYPKKLLQDFSHEYDIIISVNRVIAKEFIQLLHEYRSKKVNPSNLELEELFNPQKLYNYLRNHHWKDGIPHDFIEQWNTMSISQYPLTESDTLDFKIILNKLGIKKEIIPVSSVTKTLPKGKVTKRPIDVMPSIKDNKQQFEQWLFTRIEDIEHMVDGDLELERELASYILEEITEIQQLLGIEKEDSYEKTQDNKFPEYVMNKIKHEISSRLNEVNLLEWANLYKIKDKFTFIIRFIAAIGNFHDQKFGKDDKKDMPLKIKEFHFPLEIERILLSFNKMRNRVAHGNLQPDEIELFLKTRESKITDTYFHFLVFLIKSQVTSIINNNDELKVDVYNWIVNSYLKNDTFPVHEINLIRSMLNQSL